MQRRPGSVYGGIIAANRMIDADTAREINKIFVEVLLAQGFTEEALRILETYPIPILIAVGKSQLTI